MAKQYENEASIISNKQELYKLIDTIRTIESATRNSHVDIIINSSESTNEEVEKSESESAFSNDSSDNAMDKASMNSDTAIELFGNDKMLMNDPDDSIENIICREKYEREHETIEEKKKKKRKKKKENTEIQENIKPSDLKENTSNNAEQKKKRKRKKKKNKSETEANFLEDEQGLHNKNIESKQQEPQQLEKVTKKSY
jgi:hypothetical protein